MSHHSAPAPRIGCPSAGSRSASGSFCCSPRRASSPASSTRTLLSSKRRCQRICYRKSQNPTLGIGMAIFDTLGYARFLREGGIPQEQAETHAEAARQFIMADIATKDDLNAALEMQALRLSVRLGLMLAAGLSL